MKRLLAYLFIVLGLGLVFNSNIFAGIRIVIFDEPTLDRAMVDISKKNYTEANKIFGNFVKNNPEHKSAGKAQYWYAETFRAMGLYADAASEFLNHYQKYYKDETGPYAMLKLGTMLVEIGEKDQGCLMISGVKKQYPNIGTFVYERSRAEGKKYNCKGFESYLGKRILYYYLDFEKNISPSQIAKKEPSNNYTS